VLRLARRAAWEKMTPTDRRRTTLRYYANCSWLDAYFGQVLEKLQKMGRLDNAPVAFTSDHGEMLGERNFRFSKYCLYDSSVRVRGWRPCLDVQRPSQMDSGSQRQARAGKCDYAGSAREVAGMGIGSRGRSPSRESAGGAPATVPMRFYRNPARSSVASGIHYKRHTPVADAATTPLKRK